MNNIEEKVRNYIQSKRLVVAGDTVIVGLSGGADSVCLIRILVNLSNELGITIKAVHINHGIRGKAADADEEFARSLSNELGIDFVAYREDIPALCAISHETEEECGRRIRYEIFNKEALKSNNAKIAVAHHMNDQAETILFRIARGTGVKGLAGMSSVNKNIIRPLLCVTKEEIVSYLDRIGQEYKEDATNNELEYSRNYIRKRIIPDFEQINEEAVKHICTLSEEVKSVMSYMNKLTEEVLIKARSEGHNSYSSRVLYEQDEILRSYAIRRLIEIEGISLKDVHREHIDAIVNMLNNTESSTIHLPKGVRITVENGILSIDDCCNKESYASDFCEAIEGDMEIELPDEGRLLIRILDSFDMGQIPRNAYTKWFDYDKIQGSLVVRNRREDDYIVINTSGNTKKLSDYMINEKIPKSTRQSVAIIANGSHVNWVVGYRISEDVKVSSKTKRVIEITYTK